MPFVLNDSTAELVFGPMVEATDHRTPATGLTFTKLMLSKNAGPWADVSGIVVEVGDGSYALPAGSGFNSILGPISIHAEGADVDGLDQDFEVVGYPGAPALLKGSTTYPLLFLLVGSANHLSGAPGVSPVVTLSKNGGAFASPASPGTVAEIGGVGRGFGRYYLLPNPANYDTAGQLVLHATASGCDPSDRTWGVAGPPATASGFEPALFGHLSSLAPLAAVVGTRIEPNVLSEDTVKPALIYRILENNRLLATGGPVGTARAIVEFQAVSYDKSDCVAIREALRTLNGFAGLFTGSTLRVRFAAMGTEKDEEDEPVDSSDRWTFRKIVPFRFTYSEPRNS